MDEDAEFINIISAEKDRFQLSVATAQKESEYFSGLLNSGMKESQKREVCLPQLTSIGINVICTCLSKKHCDKADINWQNFEDTLSAANYLQIGKIITACEKFLKENLTPSNCYQAMCLGDKLMLPTIYAISNDCMKRHVKEYSEMDSFKSMSLVELCDLLSCDDLGDGNEIDIFEAVLTWVNHEKEIRHSSICTLLSEIRWCLMSPEQIRACVGQLKSLEIDKQCNQLVSTLEGLNDMPKNSQICDAKWRKVRRRVQCFVGAGGFTGKAEHSTNRFQVLPMDKLEVTVSSSREGLVDATVPHHSQRARRKVILPNQSNETVTFKSHKSTKGPEALCEHGACVCDNYLYIAGGQSVYAKDGRNTQNKVWRYDPRTSMWTSVASMRSPRSLFCLLELGDMLYAVCGWKEDGIVNKSMECYNPNDDKWVTLTPMDIGLHEHAGCTHEGSLYISGGFKGPYRGHLDKTWRYDVNADRWQQLAPMVQARSYHCMAPLNEKNAILVAGGVNFIGDENFEDIQNCELFDVESNQWSTICTIPRPASCMACLLRGHQLFLFGGHSFANGKDHNKMQILDTDKWKWEEVAIFSHGILYFSGTVLEFQESVVRRFTRKTF